MDSLYKRKGHPLTILEVLIVMAILAITLSVLAINVGGILKEQRFHSGVDLLTDKLQLAQNIMILLDSDVAITLNTNRFGQYTATLASERALTPALAALLDSNKRLPGIDSITFNESADLPITLKFSALSQALPEGTLRLAADDGSLERFITLPGHPSHITSSSAPKPIEDNPYLSAQLYPKEIRETWQPNSTP